MPANYPINQEDIDYVSSLIIEAGSLAPGMRSNIQIIEKSGPHDKVTTADLELSKIIVSKLKERFGKDKIISEEDSNHESVQGDRVWLIDPIDGTDNYIANDGQYSVMVGLLCQGSPIFGWVYAPHRSTIYYGGPQYGAWQKYKEEKAKKFNLVPQLKTEDHARIILSWRDKKNNPWIKDMPQITMVKIGSVGLKVIKILDGEADLFAYLAGKLKTWDTAGPVAIALGGHLEIGGMKLDNLSYPQSGVVHQSSIIIGKQGSVAWCRHHFANAVLTE